MITKQQYEELRGLKGYSIKDILKDSNINISKEELRYLRCMWYGDLSRDPFFVPYYMRQVVSYVAKQV